MPNPLDQPILTVDANVIHKVDTSNPTNLYSMWTVFSRCVDSVEQGRRLENLSWRLWQKEQLVENPTKILAEPLAIPHMSINDIRFRDIPQLSGSVESVADDEAIEFTSVSAPLEIIRPRILRQNSSTSSGSRRDRHTSSDDIEKMITSIVKDTASLPTPLTTKAPMAPPMAAEPPAAQTLYRSGSTTTESQSPSKNSDAQSEDSHPSPAIHPRPTNVVRGFSPSQYPIPTTSSQHLPLPTALAPIPEPTSAPAPKMVRSGKQKAAFALGGSYSSSEQSQSVEAQDSLAPPPAATKFTKNAVFKLGGSSEEEGSLKSALHSSQSSSGLKQKKQASFSNHVITHSMDEPDNAIDSDSEADYIDESAIDDDDDSSDWEDSIEDSGKSSVDEKYFQRVDSKANLTSHRSLITLMLAQSDDRARKLGNQASQSTSAITHAQAGRPGQNLGVSPNDSDDAPLMMKGARQPTLKPIKEMPRSGAQPITMTSHANGQAAMSPRTTRRNMLATELTESLRRHLLWERSQKSSTANAVLKRRHTSQDVANLKQYPEKVCMKKSEDVNSSSFNQFFSKESYEGYNAKGW